MKIRFCTRIDSNELFFGIGQSISNQKESVGKPPKNANKHHLNIGIERKFHGEKKK